MAQMVSRLDQSEQFQELFDCIYRICLEEQGMNGAMSPGSVILGAQNVSFGHGRVPPPGADNSNHSANRLGTNAVYDYGGPRALFFDKLDGENDKNGS